MKACLKPHPKFELILRCKDTGEVVRIWQLRMIPDEEGEYPDMIKSENENDIREAMNEYDGEMKCDCVNCNE